MRNPALDLELDAAQFGNQGVENLAHHAEQICAYEQKRIELTNQGSIASLLEEHRHLVAEDTRMKALLRDEPPLGDRLRLLRRAIFCWVLTLLLAGSGFALTLITLAPYRLGSKTWLYAIGVSVLTPFLIDEVLSHWHALVKVLTPVAALSGLAGVMLFAAIRGDLLGQELRENDTSAVVIDDDAVPAQRSSGNDFYASTVPTLRLALLLLAFSIEVGSGVALWGARRSRPDDSQDWKGLRRELKETRRRDAEVMRTAIDLRNEPAIFAARFRRDFYRALLVNATRKALTKALLVAAVASCFVSPKAHAQEGVDMVIAIDLTASVAVAGPDGKSEFEKDVEGVSRVLAQAPAASRITVIGITDSSFTQPYILMRARVGADPGYFGERLAAARNQLERTWKQRSAHFGPKFQRTDILGALELASQIFAEEQANRRELIIFSDMRQDTTQLNLEASPLVPTFLLVAEHCTPMPDLQGENVSVLGTGSASRPIAYWHSLKQFWAEYFRRAGANLRSYSALRELEALP